MTWYSAHIILYLELREGAQDHYLVWENIFLIGAGSNAESFEPAERLGRSADEDDDPTLTLDGKPARWVFAGVRKLVECVDPTERPGDGTEVTYNELIANSIEDVKKLAGGEDVRITYLDRFGADDREPTG